MSQHAAALLDSMSSSYGCCLLLSKMLRCRKGASVEVAGCLATVLTASHALRGLSNPDLEETPGLATLQGLVELLADESKRPAVVDTLVCTQGVLPALARLVEVTSCPYCMHINTSCMQSALDMDMHRSPACADGQSALHRGFPLSEIMSCNCVAGGRFEQDQNSKRAAACLSRHVAASPRVCLAHQVGNDVQH